MGVEQYYMQSRDLRWTSSTITQEGVCFALSLFWLQHKALHGIGSLRFWTWLGIRPNGTDRNAQGFAGPGAMEFLSENNAVLRATQEQEKLGAGATRDNQLAGVLTPFIDRLLTTETPARPLHAATRLDKPGAGELLGAVTHYYTRRERTLVLVPVGLWHGRNEAHMLACAYVPGGAIHLFDSNGGEISWTGADAFAEFMTAGSGAHRMLNAYGKLKAAAIWLYGV